MERHRNDLKPFIVISIPGLPGIDDYVCVPYKWVICVRNNKDEIEKVVVAYPKNEVPFQTRDRVRRLEEYNYEWRFFTAEIEYQSDNYEDAEFWMATKKQDNSNINAEGGHLCVEGAAAPPGGSARDRDPPKLKYKLHRKFKVFNKSNFSEPWASNFNLVASSLQHGVVFVASIDRHLAVYRVAELLDSEADPSRVTFELPEKPVLISVNCDGELLAVGLKKSVLIYSVKDFRDQDASPKQRSVPRSLQYVRDMQWSPSMNETLAIGFYYKITILHVGTEKTKDTKTTSSTRCLSWHPSGSSLVVGHADGMLSVYSPDLTLEKRIPVPDPPLFDEAHLWVVAVNWMATNQFAVVYSDASTKGRESVFTLINASEGELPPRAEYVGGLERGTMFLWYRMLQIKPWNVMLCIRDGKVVTKLLPPDSAGGDSQAPVQLVSELRLEDDLYSVGVALNRVPVHLLSSQPHLHEPTDETKTVLHVLMTTGDLTTYIVSERASTPSVDTERSGTTPCSEPVALEPPLIDSNGSFNASTASASPFGGGFKTTTNNAFGAQPAFGAAATAQPATGGGGGSGFGASTSTGGGSGFGASTSTGGGPGFGATTSTGGGSGFGATTSTGGGSGFGASTSTGGGSGFGASTSTGGGPGFGATTSAGGGSGFGATTSTGGGSGFGASTSTGGGSGFGASTSTGGGPGFGATTSAGGGSGFGATTSTGGGSGFGASTSTGGGSGFGASTSAGGGSGFGASTSTGGGSGFGATTSTGGGSGFGASTSTGGGPGFGATTSAGGGSGFGATTSTGGGSGFGASTSAGRLFGTPTAQLFQTKPAAPCTGGAPDGLPPLGFHSVHGENNMISRDGSVARRVNDFWGGLAFSARPVRINEKICFRLVAMSHNWHGVISFGFTTHDPTTMFHELPKNTRPDLTNKPGNWAQALEETFCVKDNILYYFVNSAGDVHFGVNGEDKGLFFSGVDTRSPLWAVFDVYGSCTAVQFTGPRAPSLIRWPYKIPVKSVIDARIINRGRTLSVNDPLRQLRSSLIPVRLHLIKGRNVQFTNDRGVAARIIADVCQGYVFTARPMPPGQTIVVQILLTETACAGSLAIGLTSCDPATLRPCDLPDDAEQLLDRPEYWVVRRDAASGLGRGDELAITLTLDGKVRISRNGSNPVTEMHVDHTVRLWAFVDIYGAIQKVRMLCCQTAQPPPPQLRALAGSAQNINTSGGTVLADSLPLQNAGQNANQQMTLASAHTTTTEPIQPNQLGSEHVEIPNERERDEPSTSTNTHSEIGERQLNDKECIICYRNDIDSVLYICGHMCMCYSCALQQWQGKGDGQCPLCRAEILDVIRAYV